MGDRDPTGVEISSDGLGPGEALTQHPIFWFDDAFLLLRVDMALFRIHHSLLARLSPFFAELVTLDVGQSQPRAELSSLPIDARLRYADIDRGVSSVDMEVLLQYIYHDITLAANTSFLQIDSILRITGLQQLNFPRLHETTRQFFRASFPLGMASTPHQDHLGHALRLASQFNIASVQKAILYFLVTTSSIGSEENPDPPPENPSESEPEPRDAMKPPGPSSDTPIPDSAHNEISKNEASRCSHLMTCLIEHFTPTLFTPATTQHVECTDIFADMWMPLVIQPALEDDGVYKPVETLERIKAINWVKEGVCVACTEAKREEWTQERDGVWEAMDGWLELDPAHDEM